MGLTKKSMDPNGFDRVATNLQCDAKTTLARISFETQVPMADIVRGLIEDWLISTPLPTGVHLPRRLEQLRQQRNKEKRA